MRIGCGGQCPLHGIGGIDSIGYVPGKGKLLGKNSSVKVEKGKVWGDTFIMYLSPYWSFDGSTNLCPSSSPGCRATCLVTSGQLKNPAPKQSQLDKTNFYINAPKVFMATLHKEIESIVNSKTYKDGKRNYCVRLNGTSDIPFERKPYEYKGVIYNNIMEAFPQVQFYDYTKIYGRLGKTPRNYHLTFSASETNTAQWKEALRNGYQVAMVFGALAPKMNRKTGGYKRPPGVIPTRYQGYKVVDGDDTDLTFLQPKGVILGLRSKGKAENDISGFVKRDFDGSLKAKENPKTNIPNVISPRAKSSSEVTIQFPKSKEYMKFKKGSPEAKAYMAHIRSLKQSAGNMSGEISGWTRGGTYFGEEDEALEAGDVLVKRRKRTSSKSSARRGSFMKLKALSGISKTIAGLQQQYVAIYQSKNHVIHMDVFYASSIQEARRYAQAHKKNTPELRKYKSIRTSVKLKK